MSRAILQAMTHPPWLLAVLLIFAPPCGAGEPRAKLLLQNSPLAGFQYHAGRKLWPKLRTGDRLDLVREPDNPFDSNAVRIEWQGHQIGYLPRRENLAVARRLDRGETVEARISRLAKSRNPWKRIQIDVLLPVAPE